MIYFSSNKVASKFTPGLSALSVFIGFSASKEELGMRAQNIWSFPKESSAFEDYTEKGRAISCTEPRLRESRRERVHAT